MQGGDIMFIGRSQELNWLNEQFTSGRFEMSIVYGRRRVGKTTLLQNFMTGKRSIYFLATQAGNRMNLALLSEAIYQITNPGMSLPPFQDYENAFRYVAQQAQQERLLFIIDEYPYLAAGEPAISSILQRCIDLYYKTGHGFIILCGSSMSFMEQQVLDEKSPLYGRRTAQYKICPFSFQETSQYFASQNAESKVLYFGVTGGVADYLS
ncbi:MAG TPA: ATP-binding protein, partial [Clostridiales bacterium]|nr:ATP-binding protein [Clostridiales bacterium]